MPRMRYRALIKICLLLPISLLLGACPTSKLPNPQNIAESWHLSNLIPFKKENAWQKIAANYKLARYSTQPQVRQEIHWFLQHKRYIYQLTKNAAPYIYYVFQQTEKRHLPAELALLPMIESNYNPFQYSRAGATGLWQMMPGTASGNGLTINWWYDGRRSIIGSTQAALSFLNQLHQFFGNWLQAIAAYDSGAGTVQAAINHNRDHHRATDFWKLPLPQETRNYVPKLLALATIIGNPGKYHVKLANVPNKPFFASIDMDKQIQLNQVAKLARTSLAMVRKLNPGFRRWATLPKGEYTLLLPRNKMAIFKQNLAQQKYPRATWLHHRVKQGDTLGVIAQRYQTSLHLLKQINHIKGNLIHTGQNLLIPYHSHIKIAGLNLKHNGSIAENQLPGPKRFIHTVMARDTLWRIAENFNVTPADIRYWNDLPYHGHLHFGQQLIIWLKPSYVHHKRYYDYRIKPGDNLYDLAKRFHIGVSAIIFANNLPNDIIHANTVLKIPHDYHHYHNRRLIVHRIQAGESLDEISNFYHVSVKQLKYWNPDLAHQQFLKIGQPIRVYIYS